MRRTTPTVFQPLDDEASFARWGDGWTAAGVIRALEPLAMPRRVSRIRDVFAARLNSVTVVMDAPHDPHNGAAIMRSCEAFGVQCLHAVERIEPFLVARKVSQGTERWIDVIRHRDVKSALGALERGRYELVVAHPEGELVPADLRHIERVAIMMGNERDGVCEELTRAAAHTVRVPMRGFVESLNVSVTTALLLAPAVGDRVGDLSDAEQETLVARALIASVPRAEVILGNMRPG
ncbi:MAG TPA: RNA methyltransferase [Polyangiaceae bacterium]